MLNGRVVPGESGLRGFDCNFRLTENSARRYREQSFAFVMRYIRREHFNEHDLTASEADTILNAGLMLGIVQHVESDSAWAPSKAKGERQAEVAISEIESIGVPSGAMCWLDLEGVSSTSSPDEVIAFVNTWHDDVANAGFAPALYIGWHSGLTASQLYRALKITRYWGAYNLNADEAPAVRGLCMKQHSNPGDSSIDVDFVMKDALGGLPLFLSREIV